MFFDKYGDKFWQEVRCDLYEGGKYLFTLDKRYVDIYFISLQQLRKQKLERILQPSSKNEI